MQLEIIDLQCDSSWKEKFASVSFKIFKYLFPGYPVILRDLAARILCMFRTNYLCEQVFSVMSIDKNTLHSRQTNQRFK